MCFLFTGQKTDWQLISNTFILPSHLFSMILCEIRDKRLSFITPYRLPIFHFENNNILCRDVIQFIFRNFIQLLHKYINIYVNVWDNIIAQVGHCDVLDLAWRTSLQLDLVGFSLNTPGREGASSNWVMIVELIMGWWSKTIDLKKTLFGLHTRLDLLIMTISHKNQKG